MNLNNHIKRTDDIVQAEIDCETVMMSIENGSYYGLDPIASRIWELIEMPTTVDAICSQLIQEYKVSKEECQKDVITFLSDMVEQKVALIVE